MRQNRDEAERTLGPFQPLRLLGVEFATVGNIHFSKVLPKIIVNND
jgi:hypothetical protein